MIKSKHSRKVTNPQVEILKLERIVLSNEVKELNGDLLFIQQLLKNKQEDLREVNINLIHKSTRGPFLSVVSSNNNNQNEVGCIVGKDRQLAFTCLNGGKSQTVLSNFSS